MGTDRQTDMKTDRQTDRHEDRQTQKKKAIVPSGYKPVGD